MNWKKISIIAGIVVVLAALVGFTVIHNQQGVVAVQIGTVQTQDLTSVVTASGEIKPKTYVNIGASAFGKIITLDVKEGQQVKLAQAAAQTDSPSAPIQQAQPRLTRSNAPFSKTTYVATFECRVTNLPVHAGETVVVGIQNSPGSTLMTVADLSVITAEVRVDETDIVNVKLGQAAEITIDAIPNKTFHGTVSEIGDNALVRSTGVATTQTTGSS